MSKKKIPWEEYLEKILPHKKPMILIDDIVKYSLKDNWLESIVTIREDSIFYDKNIEGISSIVGILKLIIIKDNAVLKI